MTPTSSSGDAAWRDPNVIPFRSRAERDYVDYEPTKFHRQLLESVLENVPLPEFEDDLFERLFELGSLLVTKHHDYGPLNIARSPGGPLNGLRVRLHDKLARINHLIDAGAEPEHESLRDSFVDLANYGVIALMVIDGTWPSE